MAVLTKVRHDLFPNEPASADDHDFHGCPLGAPSGAEVERPSSAAAGARGATHLGKPTCPRGLLQRLDTVHGLDGDGPEPVPRVKGSRASPRPNVELSGSVFLPPRCGLRAAHPKGGQDMRFYNQPHAAYCGVDLHARTMYVH